MQVTQTVRRLVTEKAFIDITPIVNAALRDMKAGTGVVNVFARHTTACIKLLENEILSLHDILNHLDDMVHRERDYAHDRIELRQVPPDERINGAAHVRSLYFPHSENIPVSAGKMNLGQWQTLFLVELDGARQREVLITFMGVGHAPQV